MVRKIKICIVGDNPKFLGGISTFQNNLISYALKQKFDFELTLLYRSEKDEQNFANKVNYLGLKIPKIPFLKEIIFNQRVKKFLEKNDFDFINSNATWGQWIKKYSKKPGQRIIHTYHGVTYYFYKNHLKRFSFLKRLFYSPLLLFGYFLEKPPAKKADKIICVSEKVKRQIEMLYGKRKNCKVIRTGVNLDQFKIRDKKKVKNALGLAEDNFYGLYVGKGGFWTKGLDRVVELGENIYSKNKKFRLILIGPQENKTKKFLSKKFVIFLKEVERKKMPLFYSASDIFFCLSRYEGGAPTLVVSEAMASGCLIVSSEDSQQEILLDEENSIIIDSYTHKSADKILGVIKNKQKYNKIIKNSLKNSKKFSFNSWGKEYFDFILGK